ncbi:hypothetical protein PMAYCL1PPCAC_21703 [Pristionchus mayeri]|uniref:Uncharacterized protein n=1 Tax=Pristionchus mayeri TaxID=1317129 RepID=A0AAN5I466_9BILA|nr:hypothetical protein PMAYCL1PPCAC_21703 [Pristionchus mayeri]
MGTSFEEGWSFQNTPHHTWTEVQVDGAIILGIKATLFRLKQWKVQHTSNIPGMTYPAIILIGLVINTIILALISRSRNLIKRRNINAPLPLLQRNESPTSQRVRANASEYNEYKSVAES